MLQAQPILDRVAAALEARHAHVERGDGGEVRFRVPLFWQRGGLRLRPISSGRVWLGAGWGEPWRVRYEIRFTGVRIATIVASVLLVLASWKLPRVLLVNELVGLWAIVWIVIMVARQRFRRLLTIEATAAMEGDGRGAPARTLAGAGRQHPA